MTGTKDPRIASNRGINQSLSHGITGSPRSMNMALKPTPMSRISQSAELDEYTASMRSFLASVEHSSHSHNHSYDDSGRGGRSKIGDESESSGSGSGSGSEREKSPEFRWMDLASVRREHGSANLSVVNTDTANGMGSSKTATTKQSGGHNHHRLSKETRHHHHHHHHQEHRSASPGGISLMSKERGTEAHLQPVRVSCSSSAEKHCTE